MNGILLICGEDNDYHWKDGCLVIHTPMYVNDRISIVAEDGLQHSFGLSKDELHIIMPRVAPTGIRGSIEVRVPSFITLTGVLKEAVARCAT